MIYAQKSPNYGIVYVLTNPAMPGLVKIGMTNRDSVDARLKELFNTSVPVHLDKTGFKNLFCLGEIKYGFRAI